MNPRALLAAGTVLLALGCDGNPGTAPPEPDMPGPASVSLVTPHDDVGGLVITVRGPAIATSDLEPARAGYALFARHVSTEEVRVALIGDIIDGPLFVLHVGAAGRPQAYTVTVDQVATRGNDLRDDLAGYRASLSAASQP